ncbi:MAG: FeoA family protein [Bacillota bacterium]
MDGNIVPLHQLPIGQSGLVRELLMSSRQRRRMLDLGLIEATRVSALLKSPAGDPVAYQIRGAVIALRADEARQIMIEVCSE